jgi:hypothetical protein
MATLVPITAKEFESIRAYIRNHEFDPNRVPFLGREPRNEQEVLALIVSCHAEFGIEKIVRVQTRFPDLLVKLKGKADEVHLELELYSKNFHAHGHSKDLDELGRFPKKFSKTISKKSVAVLCWIDNEKRPALKKNGPKVRDCVHRVYELKTLIRERRKIRW